MTEVQHVSEIIHVSGFVFLEYYMCVVESDFGLQVIVTCFV